MAAHDDEVEIVRVDVIPDPVRVFPDDEGRVDRLVVPGRKFLAVGQQIRCVLAGVGQPLVELVGFVLPSTRSRIAGPDIDDVQEGISASGYNESVVRRAFVASSA